MKPQNSEAPSCLQVGKPARSLATGSFPERVGSATRLQGGLRGHQVGRRRAAGTGVRRAYPPSGLFAGSRPVRTCLPRSGLCALTPLAAALRMPGPVRVCLYACACLCMPMCLDVCVCACACVHAGAPRPQRSLLQKLFCPFSLCLRLPEAQLPAAPPAPDLLPRLLLGLSLMTPGRGPPPTPDLLPPPLKEIVSPL